MRIGIPKEPAGVSLVAATPDSVAKLKKLGYVVCVEAGAGERASFPDEQYEAAGAHIMSHDDIWETDIVICTERPGLSELSMMKKGAMLVSRLNPNANPGLVEAIETRGLTSLALDMVPRISRAQALDVRSSMMNVAGYRAVVEAANAFPRTFGGQVTAAGNVPPARVYVIGVGVAGLAAIGTAGSLGAQVYATDVRPEVADQVESLGGRFVEIPVKQESADGYAKALSDDEQNAALAVYTREAAESDVVITTAQVPGRPAPLLITAEAVAGMKPGSVIVDMGASKLGGNCELSKPGEVVVTENGVTIIGYDDLPGRLPSQASRLFGQNVVNLFKLLTPEKDGKPVVNEEDEVIRGMTVTLDGRLMWPPPPVKVSAAPAPKKEEEKAEEKSEGEAAAAAEEAAQPGLLQRFWWAVLLAIAAIALIVVAPPEMAGHFIVFELAVVVGFYVITAVTHSLHTPLMSVTNAISGIIVVGAILLAHAGGMVGMILSFIAIAIASINIFGGFLVTNRMLGMFDQSSGSKKPAKAEKGGER